MTSSSTTSSYFNDTITLDTNALGSSTNKAGLAGIDELVINFAYSNASFSSDLGQFTYTKADRSFADVYLDSVERIRFTDKVIALDIDGNAGEAYRLYKAAFDRTPDKEGLGSWIGQLDSQALDKSNLLISFAESSENKIALTGLMEKDIEYVA